MKKTFIYCLSAALLLSVTACSDDSDNFNVQNPSSDDVATVRVALGIEGRSAARNSRALTPEDYVTSATSPEISDGTRATTLIYALYKKESNGSYTALKIDGADENAVNKNYQVIKEGVKFPYQELSFDLVKGFEYVMVFWAQSPESFENKYFDTSDLQAIKINYNDMNNNDELRDAFCAKYELKVTQNEEIVNVTLKRPFAQINVGLTPSAWDALRRNWKHPATSAIQLSGICNTYNLVKESAVYDETHPLQTVEFKADTVPCSDNYLYNTSKFLKIDMNHDGKYNGIDHDTPESFYWVSMCYVLVPDYVGTTSDNGETVYSTTVDLNRLDLNYAEYNTPDVKEDAGTLRPDPVPNLPVLRNHRTNLILDGWPFVTKDIMIHLDNEFIGVVETEEAGAQAFQQ